MISDSPLFTRRVLGTAGALLLGGLLAACGGGSKSGSTLVSLTIGDWSSFDPAQCYETGCGEVLQNTLETLYFPKGADPGSFEPLLADGMPAVSDGGKTYTVKLNDKARFSDGTPVISADVKYDLMRTVLMSTDGGPSALLREPILGSAAAIAKTDTAAYGKLDAAIATPDSHTVVFHLAKPFSPFVSILANPAAAVYSKAAAVKSGEWNGEANGWQAFSNADQSTSKFLNVTPVGSGPFVLSRYEKASQVILRRNDKYWRSPAKVQTVVIKATNQPSTAVQLLKTGDADMIGVGTYSANVKSQFAGLQGVGVTDTIPTLALTVVLMNENIRDKTKLGSGTLSEKGIPANFFADKNVRLGFAHSFDYAGFIKQQLLGAGIQTNTVLVKGLTGYSNKLRYSFDQAAAEAAFKKAWGGKLWQNGFSVSVYWNSGNLARQQAATLLKRGIERLNPKFHIQVQEAQFSQINSDAAAGRGSVWFSGWQADYADPHNFAQPILASDGVYAYATSYKNPQLDALIDSAVTTPDGAARNALYAQIEEIGYADAPVIPIDQPVAYTAQRDTLKGRVVNPIFPGAYFYPISKGD